VSEPESLLELLACPKCHGSLHRVSAPEGLGCAACALFYAIDDGLPNMLIDDAKPWTPPTAENSGP
jgi:uncharacterized protein